METLGFRTFLRVDGQFYEPFQQNCTADFSIGMNEFALEETSKEIGLRITVRYFILPNETVGALARSVTVENLTGQARQVEMLDGLAAVIPYGIGMRDMKEMAQTMTAWMQVEDVEERMPYYRVRYSTKDSEKVQEVKAGNFILGVSGSDSLLPVIADPGIVFGYDVSLRRPVGLLAKTADELAQEEQCLQNQIPCGFTCQSFRLEKAGVETSYLLSGSAGDKKALQSFVKKGLSKAYFEKKRTEAEMLAEELTSGIYTKTANTYFDAYCSQTYLDNVLRGGHPVKIGKKGVFYIYSRKHGDLERDYNYFTMVPEYFSQGNGNFRDLDQNRRSDVCFEPWIGDYNVKLFYNLIQLDGYNPLVVNQVVYRVGDMAETPSEAGKPDAADSSQGLGRILALLPGHAHNAMREFMRQPFSPGQLCACLFERKIEPLCGLGAFLDAVADNATQEMNADFSEGYWIDHWTYNLDLVEEYLKIYPDKEETLLFQDCSYTYYESGATVMPRSQRYVRTKEGVRQYHSVREKNSQDRGHGKVCTAAGNVYHTNLVGKLMALAANKFASLDMYGMGIEMEAGKPGWYDALNGLPSMFGSSMCETYELVRLLRFMERLFENDTHDVLVPVELYALIQSLQGAVHSYYQGDFTKTQVWDAANCAKELYRKQTADGIDGSECRIKSKDVEKLLSQWEAYVRQGIQLALTFTTEENVPPTYFTYQFSDFTESGASMELKNLRVFAMPLFLEGPVHYMKLLEGETKKKELYEAVRKSDLYDRALHMYKVNAPLERMPPLAGRARAFSPGWLENESVWLHMEYKYLLELLKSGLYKEFFGAMKDACIPFLDSGVYGRSTLENCSFLVSSANSNRKLWGHGYVSRLSGATAEFLEMWQVMMFGVRPFQMQGGELSCSFTPAIPGFLVPSSGKVECTAFGCVRVTYNFEKSADVIPGQYETECIRVTYGNGESKLILGGILNGKDAQMLRAGEMLRLDIVVHLK